MVFDFNFYCVTVKTLYRNPWESDRKCLNHEHAHSFDRCDLRASGRPLAHTAVKLLGRRVIYALPVTFPFHHTNFHGQPPPLEPLSTKSNHSVSTKVLLPSFTA